MARSPFFASPMFVGFERFEELLERMAKASSDGYPPYNIEQIDDRHFRISLAVAGFSDDQLSVTVEDNQLIVGGKQEADGERAYLHRGIAARQFQRSFVLASGLEVASAWLDNGLLHIEIEHPSSQARARRIEIGRGPGAAAPPLKAVKGSGA